jgi:hypothetical protein
MKVCKLMIMEAKECAQGLIEKMRLSSLKITKKDAKVCASIAAQYIINANPHSNPLNTEVHPTMRFWQDVKREIDK